MADGGRLRQDARLCATTHARLRHSQEYDELGVCCGGYGSGGDALALRHVVTLLAST